MCHFFPGISLVYFCIFVFAIKMPTATEVIPFFYSSVNPIFSSCLWIYSGKWCWHGLLLIDKKAPFLPHFPRNLVKDKCDLLALIENKEREWHVLYGNATALFPCRLLTSQNFPLGTLTFVWLPGWSTSNSGFR